MREISGHPAEFEQKLVHTGQHYDRNMSQVFFEELDLPLPDINLGVGSGSHAQQTAQVMQRFEPVLLDYRPDWLIVPGDVNSTMAASLVASKLGIKIAHIEAGLRSFDRTMPEEINRLVTDQIADLLLTPSRDGDANLLREGVAPEKIRFVGNVMIDSLVRLLPKAELRWESLRRRLKAPEYILVTLHRPANVDNPETLREIIFALTSLAQDIAVVFPVHPRTRERIAQLENQVNIPEGLQFLEPLGYLDFLALQIHARLVLTDSGGVQEETTYLGIPCLTARPNTERPVTLTEGTNRLVRCERDTLVEDARAGLNQVRKGAGGAPRPEFWDGQTAKRIVHELRGLGAAG